MSPLGEKRRPGLEAGAQEAARVGDVGLDALGGRLEHPEHVLRRRDIRAAEGTQQRARLGGDRLEARSEDRRAEELGDADSAPGRDRLVGRSDAPQRRADLRVARGRLASRVHQPVPGEDDRRAVRDQQVLADLHARGAHGVDLGEESLEVEDDPRPDDADAAPDDPRGQQVEREVLVPELDRVPGVVAAVVPRHDLESVGEEVDELALALVAPLPAQDRQDLHGSSPR